MEFPITIFLTPVMAVVGLGVALFYFACKPYWDEQDRNQQPPTDSDLER